MKVRETILSLFLALWFGNPLSSLEVILEKYYPHYDPNGYRVYWVSDDTLLLNLPYDIESEIILLNIQTNKGRIIKLPSEEKDAKNYHLVTAIDREQKKFIFRNEVTKGKAIIKDTYYEYDVASGTMTELVSNTEVFKDFHTGDKYFIDLTRYIQNKYYNDKTPSVLLKCDRSTGEESVIYTERDELYLEKILDYDRTQNVLLAQGPINRLYLVPYDGTTCGEPVETGYSNYGSTGLVWGKYILGFGNKYREPPIISVGLWSSTTKKMQEIPKLFTFEDSDYTHLFAVNHRTNQIAVVGYYDLNGKKNDDSGLYIFRVLVEGEINDDRVRYRSGPSTSAEILGMFNKNDKVKVIEQSQEKATIGGQEHYWYKVRTRDGKDVWVYGAYLTILD